MVSTKNIDHVAISLTMYDVPSTAPDKTPTAPTALTVLTYPTAPDSLTARQPDSPTVPDRTRACLQPTLPLTVLDSARQCPTVLETAPDPSA